MIRSRHVCSDHFSIYRPYLIHILLLLLIYSLLELQDFRVLSNSSFIEKPRCLSVRSLHGSFTCGTLERESYASHIFNTVGSHIKRKQKMMRFGLVQRESAWKASFTKLCSSARSCVILGCLADIIRQTRKEDETSWALPFLESSVVFSVMTVEVMAV